MSVEIEVMSTLVLFILLPRGRVPVGGVGGVLCIKKRPIVLFIIMLLVPNTRNANGL